MSVIIINARFVVLKKKTPLKVTWKWIIVRDLGQKVELLLFTIFKRCVKNVIKKKGTNGET